MTVSTQIVIQGNNLDVLPKIPDASIDAIVTDPPYGLAFMGKSWDKTLPDPRTWSEALRVLKPGGHALIFGAPRLYHRLAVAVEDAGFEVRDVLMWMFGSGFPKSLDVSKAIDASLGAERSVVAPDPHAAKRNKTTPQFGGSSMNTYDPGYDGPLGRMGITAPATPEAAAWAGWGTALKPAYEPILLVRKPLIGTVAQNVLTHGTGGINVDACRVGWASEADKEAGRPASFARAHEGFEGRSFAIADRSGRDPVAEQSAAGRWPANVIMDEEAGAMLDASTPPSKSGKDRGERGRGGIWASSDGTPCGPQYGDSGGASRFFYCPKASRSEREAGLDAFEARVGNETLAEDGAGRNSPRAGAGRKGGGRKNHHPTVKPLDLMAWCVKLVTPPGGVVLDMFAGSGSTPAACAKLGISCLGIELDPEYVAIGNARIAHWSKKSS